MMRCITITQDRAEKRLVMPPIAKCVQIQQANPFFPNLPFTQLSLQLCVALLLCFVTTIGRLGYLGCNFLVSHTLLFTLIKSFFPDKFGTDETPPTRDLRLPELVKNPRFGHEGLEKGRVVPLSTQILQKCSDFTTDCHN